MENYAGSVRFLVGTNQLEKFPQNGRKVLQRGKRYVTILLMKYMIEGFAEKQQTSLDVSCRHDAGRGAALKTEKKNRFF